MPVALLAGPIDAGNLRATLNGLILDINAAGTTSAPIPLMAGSIIPGSVAAMLNGLFLQINDVTAPGTVPLLAGPVELADVRALLNNAIVEFNAFGGGSSYTGPLDIVSGAVVAYGQRALSAAMRGTALYTIREDAGDTTQSFNSDATTGDAPVAAITSFLDGANGFVTTWNNQGSGSDLINATNAEQPEWLANVINNKPGIAGVSTVSKSLAAGDPIELSAITAFFVIKITGPENPEMFSMSVPGGGAAAQFYPGASTFQTFLDVYDNSHEQGNQTAATTWDPTEFHLLEYKAGTDVMEIRFDGVVCALTGEFGDGVFPTISSALVTRLSTANAGLVTRTEGEIYNALLSDPDCLAIRQNIASYYGIPLA